MSDDPSENGNEILSILDKISVAKEQVLAGGVTSVSSGGRSVAVISLETLQEMERQELMKSALESGPFQGTVRNTPYDSRW